MNRFLTSLILLSHLLVCQSQGFLRVEDIIIVNDEGPFIIRSIGTGNWMIQEGYMMQSTDAGINTHTQFRNKLNETMGVERTNEFYAHWLDHHFTKTDLDSLKAWGFNTIRPALHYKWFTLPIEEEERNSNGTIQNTWLSKGFDMLDKLVAWCEENQMYVIFDMHGAPGGQGKDANISDYDQSQPSLWESNDNQEKLLALWTKIAKRYKNNPWVGGYDIINEPNWDVDGNTQNENGCECQNNAALWSLHQRLINAIRSVDKTHIIFISGNCWGNNYKGFENHALNGYDDNTVLTFHKYWNSNAQNAIQWAIDMRQQYNMPLWMSESGENSNHWFAEAIELFEKNNIGWSWWPVKKSRLNNVLKVTTNENYYELVNSWKDGSKRLSAEETYNAVMSYADAHKIENCTIAPDVIFALNSGSHVSATKPYMHHKTEEWIQCVHYDLGKDGDAYHDALSEDIHDSSRKWAKWNAGNHFRNDGVDIGKDLDGYYVGWTEPDEWLQYTINAVQSGYYKLDIMSAAATAGGRISFLVNGAVQASNIQLPVTESGEEWNSTQIKKIYLPAGEMKVRIRIESGGSNLRAFKLTQYSELSVREGRKLASSRLVDSCQ